MSDPTVHDPDEEWDALLRQLQRQPVPQPRPFFYARVHARLGAGRPLAGSWLPGWLRRPAYVVLLGALGLALSGDDAALRPAVAAAHPGPAAVPLPY